MAKFLRGASIKPGAAPGSLIFVGTKKTEKVSIRALRYDEKSCESMEDLEPDHLREVVSENHRTWIDVIGLHETEIMKRMGDIFEMHPLLMEDILNTDQRPKFEEFPNHNAIILKMLYVDSDQGVVQTEQVSVVAGKDHLICFQEAAGDVFDGIRNRIINQTTKIRERGVDYLAFALLDAIVDHYIVSIEYFGNEIEKLEVELLTDVQPEHLVRINTYKKEINSLRRIVRPVLELTFQYEKSESKLISRQTLPFIKDLEDHITQAAEAIEIYKELLNDQLSFYHTTMSNRLNDTIRVLTVFSVIFIPLSFLAGVYGTNFQHFPELEYKYAYPAFWGIEIAIAGLMLFYFYRKKWL
jgi:magnesium transporter